jgi:hypothetical protein
MGRVCGTRLGRPKEFLAIGPDRSRQQEQGTLENTPEAVEAWAVALHQRFGGRPIAVCLEQARGALDYMLSKYAHLVLFPVHPTVAARYRETFCTSGAKDDPGDTASLLDLLMRYRERLRQLQSDTVETRLVQFLVEERRRTVNEKTRQSNRLTDCLKLYFPQALRWFDDVGARWWGICWNVGPVWRNCGARTPARCASSSRSILPIRRAQPGTDGRHLSGGAGDLRCGGVGSRRPDGPRIGGAAAYPVRPH